MWLRYGQSGAPQPHAPNRISALRRILTVTAKAAIHFQGSDRLFSPGLLTTNFMRRDRPLVIARMSASIEREPAPMPEFFLLETVFRRRTMAACASPMSRRPEPIGTLAERSTQQGSHIPASGWATPTDLNRTKNLCPITPENTSARLHMTSPRVAHYTEWSANRRPSVGSGKRECDVHDSMITSC